MYGFRSARGRRASVAVVVIAGHLTLWVVLRNDSAPATAPPAPQWVSILLPLERAPLPRQLAARERPALSHPRGASRRVHSSREAAAGPATQLGAPPGGAPPGDAQPGGAAPESSHDWYGDLPAIAQDQIAADAARRRADEWLSRGADPETHPLMHAFQPLYPGPKSTFGWDHVHTRRIEPIAGGGLLVWLTQRCAVAYYVLLVIPGCAIGHLEANGGLFQDMHLDERIDTPISLP